MNCPNFEQLAAAAANDSFGDHDALLTHLDTCEACQHALDEQLDTRSLINELSPVVLSARHRESLAAEVMARADVLPARTRRLRPVAGLVLAAAAALALVIGLRSQSDVIEPIGIAPTPVEVATTPLPDAAPTPVPAPEDPAPPAPVVAPTVVTVPRAKLEGDADYARSLDGDRETVKLSTGSLTVDARHAHPVRVVTGDTAIAVKKARIKVTADKGVISQVDVFAGSVEVTLDGKTQTIVAGEMWSRPSSSDDSLVAFRGGWKALRRGDYAEAIKFFDHATDEVVAEDAMYWAAVASERNDDPTGALTRYQQLLDRFPHSTRAKEAKAAIARLK